MVKIQLFLLIIYNIISILKKQNYGNNVLILNI